MAGQGLLQISWLLLVTAFMPGLPPLEKEMSHFTSEFEGKNEHVQLNPSGLIYLVTARRCADMMTTWQAFWADLLLGEQWRMER